MRTFLGQATIVIIYDESELQIEKQQHFFFAKIEKQQHFFSPHTNRLINLFHNCWLCPTQTQYILLD